MMTHSNFQIDSRCGLGGPHSALVDGASLQQHHSKLGRWRQKELMAATIIFDIVVTCRVDCHDWIPIYTVIARFATILTLEVIIYDLLVVETV